MTLEDLLSDEQIVDSYTVRIPIRAKVSGKQYRPINLNVYRNLHHYQLNTQKTQFYEEVKDLLRHLPVANRIWIHYTIFAPSNHRLDTMNVGSILDKYFCDVLVTEGKIPDDNVEHVVFSSFSFGGVAKLDGHAIATINILKKENETMRVMLDEDDIQSALTAFVTETLKVPGATGVDLTTNQDGEIEAEVTFDEVTDTDTDTDKEEKPKKTSRRGRPKGSKNKPKEESADVAETSGDSGDRSSDDDADGRGESKETESPEKSSGTSKGNLFGDKENPSSDSESPDNEGDTEKVEEPKVSTMTKKNKSSIFDV